MKKLLLAAVCLGMVSNVFAAEKLDFSKQENISMVLIKVIDGSYAGSVKEIKAGLEASKTIKSPGLKLIQLVNMAKPASDLMDPIRLVAEKASAPVNSLFNLIKKNSNVGTFLRNNVDKLADYLSGLAQFSELADMFVSVKSAQTDQAA